MSLRFFLQCPSTHLSCLLSTTLPLPNMKPSLKTIPSSAPGRQQELGSKALACLAHVIVPYPPHRLCSTSLPSSNPSHPVSLSLSLVHKVRRASVVFPSHPPTNCVHLLDPKTLQPVHESAHTMQHSPPQDLSTTVVNATLTFVVAAGPVCLVLLAGDARRPAAAGKRATIIGPQLRPSVCTSS